MTLFFHNQHLNVYDTEANLHVFFPLKLYNLINDIFLVDIGRQFCKLINGIFNIYICHVPIGQNIVTKCEVQFPNHISYHLLIVETLKGGCKCNFEKEVVH